MYLGKPREGVIPGQDDLESNSSDRLVGISRRVWLAQYTSVCAIAVGLERIFGETVVALHPRLQDRASFGDYCRGATPG